MSDLPVSLIIPCYGRPQQTRDLLHSIARSTVSCEIVVVDDGSPHPIAEVLTEFEGLKIKHLHNTKNRGAAAARNQGVAASTHKFIAFTDNDCIVDTKWLETLYHAIERATHNVAGIGGRVTAAGRDIYSRYYDYHKILDPWYHRGKFYYLTTANAIFKRHVFELVGGFDETVHGAGGEDPGLCFKLQNAGYELGFTPDAVVLHQYTPTLKAFRQTFFRYGYGCAGQSARHYREQKFAPQTAFGGQHEGLEP